MQMQRCPHGHYYDAALHSECPYCSGMASKADIGVTRPVAHPQQPKRDGATVAVIRKELGIDPVVGWLVCIEGAAKGKDYRLHAGNNYIGRSPEMDIYLEEDATITRGRQAMLTFDLPPGAYYLTPGEGRDCPRLAGKPVLSTGALSPYDEIRIGETLLLFLPLCSERFQWK